MSNTIRTITAAAVTALTALALSATAVADTGDPHMPDMSAGHCPGGFDHIKRAQHCRGEPYPDGTQWLQTTWGDLPPMFVDIPLYDTAGNPWVQGMKCVAGEWPHGIAMAPPEGCAR